MKNKTFTKEQLNKLLKTLLIFTGIILALEIVFTIPAVDGFFVNLLDTPNRTLFYVILWFIMFLQTNILNIPAYVVLQFSLVCGIVILSPVYLIVVFSAYVVGSILTYWLGRWFGSKAVKWIAGNQEEFEKWCGVISNKGKWWYAATVVLPIFPDDLLCFVAGSVKMPFWFYFIVNFLGRGIGLVVMCYFLTYVRFMGAGFPIMLVVWAVVFVGLLVWVLVNNRKKGDK